MKDYAKKPAASPHYSIAAVLVIVAAVAIVALLILLLLQKHPQKSAKSPATNVNKTATEPQQPANITEYDFYTELTNSSPDNTP